MNAAARAARRRGSGLGGPSHDPEVALDRRSEVAWLQPVPDALIGDGAVAGAARPGDPAAIVAARDSIRLAFIAALQYLPARQRAVLILRDVLAWRAAEVAELLGTSTAAVNSLLQRARAQLDRVAPAENEITEPGDASQRALLDQYVAAFSGADVPALMRLLRADAELEMPPYLTWFSGREAIARFLAARTGGVGGIWRTARTRANGQPAIAVYLPGSDGVPRAHAIQVVTVTGPGIARIICAFQRTRCALVRDVRAAAGTARRRYRPSFLARRPGPPFPARRSWLAVASPPCMLAPGRSPGFPGSPALR